MNYIPKPYEVYKHFKGNKYQIITLAENSETGEMQVVYQALYSPYKVYVRPLEMFTSLVDTNKYPNAEQKYRFQKIEETEITETGNAAETNEKKEEETYLDAEEVLDPLLVKFLDSETYEEKLSILVSLQHTITNDMINTMAMALDIEVPEGETETRYEALKNCLATLERYECNRLR